jgi:hypothetical protein
LRSNSSVWVFDATNLSFLREDHFDNPMQCVSLRLNPGLGIDLKRAPAVGASHGTVSFNVEFDPELWCELTDGIGVGTSLVGRVIGGAIEWAALRAWREFPQAENTLAMEESIVLLCEATRCAYTRGLFEPHHRLDRCVA